MSLSERDGPGTGRHADVWAAPVCGDDGKRSRTLKPGEASNGCTTYVSSGSTWSHTVIIVTIGGRQVDNTGMSRVRRARLVTVSDHSVVAPGQSDRDRRGSHARQAGAERTALAAGLLLAVSLVCAGCALPGSTSAAASSPSPAADAAADVVRAHGQPQATLDPVAPQSLAPVTRDGKAAGPRVPAVDGGLSATKPVTYPDGVSVTVERIRRGSETGEGPGEFPGRPYAALVLSLTNGSTTAIDLNQVVVNNTVYATGSFTKARPPGVAAGGAGEVTANNIFA